MRLAVVVQRYGLEISGGAELHARLVAERLSSRHAVTILTTCARDYVTWANEYSPGVSSVNGLPVYRFPVRRPRDPEKFGRLQQRVFDHPHGDAEARAWLDAQGPYAPRMIGWIRAHREHYNFFICFSYRYWTTAEAMRAVPGQAILVPTAERDPAIAVPLYRAGFRDARAIVYNSHEERAMIAAQAHNEDVPGDVVGVGIVDPPASHSPPGVEASTHGNAPSSAATSRFRARRQIEAPFILYIGRIDENKGCAQLFRFYEAAHDRLVASGQVPPHLVLAGSAIMPIPDHPSIHHLGRVDEEEKYDALAAADALVMPSFFESLSMVLLEAWALGRPVLVNGHCDVLEGQVRRSNGGLYYRDADQFSECLQLLSTDQRLRKRLGEGGRDYYMSNYTWPVIEQKYERLLGKLAAGDDRRLPRRI